MTRPRLHLPQLRAGSLTLEGESFHYLAHVLRVRPGDQVALFDGAGHEAAALVVTVDVDRLAMELAVGEPAEAPARRPRVPVWLMCALLKGEKMDLVIQKATELGAGRLVPMTSARSVVKLEADRAVGRVERWRRIAREAAKQCGRADALEVADLAPLPLAVASAPPDALRILLWEDAAQTALRELLAAPPPPGGVVLVIGPEGGFAPAEVAAAREAGFSVAGLGPRVLRAETAALAALAIVEYACGDLG